MKHSLSLPALRPFLMISGHLWFVVVLSLLTTLPRTLQAQVGIRQ